MNDRFPGDFLACSCSSYKKGLFYRGLFLPLECLCYLEPPKLLLKVLVVGKRCAYAASIRAQPKQKDSRGRAAGSFLDVVSCLIALL